MAKRKSRKKGSGRRKAGKRKASKSTAKRRTRKSSKRRGKGKVPLAILEKRLKKLNSIVKSRKGKACAF